MPRTSTSDGDRRGSPPASAQSAHRHKRGRLSLHRENWPRTHGRARLCSSKGLQESNNLELPRGYETLFYMLMILLSEYYTKFAFDKYEGTR